MKTKIFLLLLLLVSALPFYGQNAKSRPGSVHGYVKNSEGEPLIGVTVNVVGTNTYAISDINGRYEIVAKPGSKLDFNYIGFSSQVVPVSQGQTQRDIVMVEDKEDLDEVVVIGYGTAKKKDLTGSIATIRADKLEEEVPKSVQDILRSSAVGLYVGMSTDAAGTASMQIRGKNTLTAGSDPLLVVDGVIYNGSLQDINPMDIESVDVLKDASSAAVYGARAANGVIAITTKRGNTNAGNKPTITVTTNFGFESPSHLPKICDGKKFLAVRQAYEEGTKNDAELAKTPGFYSDPRTLGGSVDLLSWYNYDMKDPVSVLPNERDLVSRWLSRLELNDIEIQNYLAGKETNWDDILYQTGFQQDYTLAIQNRSDKYSYYWSLGYANREAQIVGSRYENFRSRLNLDYKVTSFLNVGMNAQFSNRKGGALTADTGQRLNLTPYSEFTTDRTSPYAQYPNGDPSAANNPLWDNYFRDRDELTTRLLGSLYAKLTLPFGITFSSTFSPDFQWYHYYNTDSSENPSWKAKGGYAIRRETHDFNWQIDNVLNWQYTFNDDHHVEVTLLQNAEKKRFWETKAEGTSASPTDVLGYHRLGVYTVPTINSNDTQNTGDALMARLFYSYASKYMFTGSIRRDGYSAFGRSHPRATFPSLALGWVFTEEKFMKPIENILNYGKLRLSWGQNGNNSIGQYEALAQLTSGLFPYIDTKGTPYLGSQIYINHMGNDNLKWEKTSAWNIGLNLAFFNSRLRATVDAYFNKTTDLLVQRSLPQITGYSDVKDNLGQLNNHGLEISLEGDPVISDNFKWSSYFSFSFNRRKLKKLYGNMIDVTDDQGNVIGKREADDTSNGWYINHDPDEIYDYAMNGVWQLGEEEEAAKYGLKPGDFKYVDQDGDGQLNTKDKVFYNKYKKPRYYLNWRNEFTFYHDFVMSFLMYAQLGEWNTFNKAANITGLLDRRNAYDVPRWTKDNPTNKYARMQSTNRGNHYINKSFIRMDNISLTYRVPNKWTSPYYIHNLRVSFNIRNPFVICTDWDTRNGDPQGGDNTYKSYTLSINFSI